MLALGGMDDRQLNRAKRSLGLGRSEPYRLPLNFEALFVPVRHEEAVLIAPQVLFYNMRAVRLLGGQRMEQPPACSNTGSATWRARFSWTGFSQARRSRWSRVS